MANKWNKAPKVAQNIYVTLVMYFLTIPGLEWGCWVVLGMGLWGHVWDTAVTSASWDVCARDGGDRWGSLGVPEGH